MIQINCKIPPSNTCSGCRGQGRIVCPSYNLTGIQTIRHNCVRCGGAPGNKRCHSCFGKGSISTRQQCGSCNGQKRVICNICHGRVGLPRQLVSNQMQTVRTPTSQAHIELSPSTQRPALPNPPAQAHAVHGSTPINQAGPRVIHQVNYYTVDESCFGGCHIF